MNKLITLFLLNLLLLVLPTFGSITPYENTWHELLKSNITVAKKNNIKLNIVNYKNIKKDPKFIQLLQNLNSFDIKTLKSKKAKLAFWINAYNIAAVKMITDHYPLHSIKDRSRLFNSVWDQEIIMISGQKYSLGYIEHLILRRMNEPRIHFAVVDASASCPDLRNEPYTAAKLNEQLTSQTTIFLNNSGKGLKVDNEQKTIYISSIFKWFKKDFKNTRSFLRSYSPKHSKIIDNYKIEYLPYDWSLNGKENN